MRATDQAAPSSPLATALLKGSAPRAIRLSAARGVLPLPRIELVHILIVLLRDADDEVNREATRLLGSLPEQEVLGILADPTSPADVLDHFGASGSPATFIQAVLANPSTPPSTLRRLAPSLVQEHIDLLLLNQMRLIDTPDLLDDLSANPALTPLQRSRLEEFRRHFLGKTPTPAPAVRADAPTGEPWPETAPVGDESGAAAAPGAPLEQTTIGAELGTAESRSEAAAQRIQRMNTAEKIQLAMKGTREDRAILIKDSSKIVHQAVMESPKLSDNEVESMARMRSVTEDVLRAIAANRDWMKNYAVVHGLTTNPKTPAGVAMNLVGRLNARDLKLIAGDRNVPDLIRRQARKVMEARNEGRR